MFIKIRETIGNVPVALIMREATKQRLSGTCFRGSDHRVAGNFFRWNNCNQMFTPGMWWMPRFMRDVREAHRLGGRTQSFSFREEYQVGWSGTDRLDKYSSDDLEPFSPNRRSSALRVRINRHDLKAPKTDVVTIVYELRKEESLVAVVIHSVYPGEDIGEIIGDMSSGEGIVFFDWNHPGAV